MMDWNGYRDELLGRVGELGKLTPDTLRGVVSLDRAGEKANHLGPKMRELIALAVAVTTRCDGCIAVHSKAAIEHGATEEEIASVVGSELARKVYEKLCRGKEPRGQGAEGSRGQGAEESEVEGSESGRARG